MCKDISETHIVMIEGTFGKRSFNLTRLIKGFGYFVVRICKAFMVMVKRKEIDFEISRNMVKYRKLNGVQRAPLWFDHVLQRPKSLNKRFSVED